MSPLILLAVIAGCVSATTIRDYTGGNSVEDILDHQDSWDDGGNEIPTLPEDNIDVEMINATIPNMHCWDYYTCASNVETPVPAGSLRKGYYFSTLYVKQICKNLHQVLSCYRAGDYSDCPGTEESFTASLSFYNYACIELDRSDLKSVLRCANNYDVQLSVYTSFIAFSSSLNTTMSWPNANSSDTSQMICWAIQNVKQETGGFIRDHCPINVVEVYDRMIDISFQPFSRAHNCDLQSNDYGH